MTFAWWSVLPVYSVGVAVGMFLTMIADERPRWYERPLILVWPLVLVVRQDSYVEIQDGYGR